MPDPRPITDETLTSTIKRDLFVLRDIRPDGCELWKGEVQDGHAILSDNGKVFFVSRLVYYQHGTPKMRDKLQEHYVLRTCGNNLCVNKAHLRLGTEGE